MKTVFCLFPDAQTARHAIDHLADRNFPRGQMNIIVLAQVAKNTLGSAQRGPDIPVTGDSSHKTPYLDQMLAGKQPVSPPGVGRVLSVGELANVLTSTASSPPQGVPTPGMVGALSGFGLSKPVSEKLTAGVKNGGVLFFLRTEDERSSELVSALRSLDGSNQVHFVG
jgi:hypothetical protein